MDTHQGWSVQGEWRTLRAVKLERSGQLAPVVRGET